MQTLFFRTHNPASWALRSYLWSSWSHCGIVTPEQTVIHAAPFRGVVEDTVGEFLAGASRYSPKDIWLPHDDKAIEFARAQIGKSYDWRGVAGIGLREDSWARGEYWFCNELIEAACRAGGRDRFVMNTGRVTPQHTWMVL